MLTFRASYYLVGRAPFFTFDSLGADVSCLLLVPSRSSDKEWKKKFFYLDATVVQGNMA
ncbi:hypothetical protein Hanom_Chr15g01406881 [Helianthus anomalus]